MMRQYSFLRTALIAGIAIGAAGTAMAQQSPAKDPVKVSVFKGTVAQYAQTPRVVRYGFETPDWACSGRQG